MMHWFAVVLLQLFCIVTSARAGWHGCFVTDTTWAANTNQGFVNVTSKEECQSICEESSDCQGFTHFNGKASPFANFCETFPTIHSSIPCSNCVSGPSSCICSGPYTCSLDGEALLGLDFGVASEDECAESCWNTDGCNFYSYFSSNSSPLKLACAKLSDCNDRKSDPNVVSGPSDCSSIAIVSESYPMCFKTGTSWVHNISTTIPDVPSLEECQSLCLHSYDCIAFTWHKVSEEFTSKLCELFPTIGETTDECPDCISGPKSCTCSDGVACSFDDQYFIDILTEIATEEQCQELCARDPKCYWYTWYSSEGWPFSLACALLSECSDGKDIPDGSVRSGPADCPILPSTTTSSTTTTTTTTTTITTSTSTEPLPEQCKNYNVLDSYSRNYMVSQHNFCSNSYCCDQEGYNHVRPEWKGAGWYRISGQAGTKLIDTPVNHNGHYNGYCGTDFTGWLSRGHPSPEEGVVSRTVCFASFDHMCSRQVQVNVLNCNDDYFVYYLPNAPGCSLGYCTE